MELFESFAEHSDVDYDPHYQDPSYSAFHNFRALGGPARGVGKTLLGPHQYREFNLMVMGRKPIAMPDVHEPDSLQLWLDTAKEKGWSVRRVDKLAGNKKGWLFCQPGQEWRMDKLAAIYADVRSRKGRGNKMRPADHARIGLLLGYSKEAVGEFLQKVAYR